MITHKQLTLAEVFEDCQNKFDNNKYQFLLFLIFTPKPEGLASTSFIQCSKHFCSSVFSQSRRTRSWLCSWNTLRNCVTSVALMLYRMVQNSLALNRISYRTYNLCSIILLIWPNRYAKNWIRLLLTWQSSIPPALKHGLWKIIRSMPTHAASNQAIQQMYINGHFCYAYKFGLVTNGLGIVRDISIYNKDFLNAHPDIVVGCNASQP